MKTTRIPPLTPAQAEALQARFARRLGARLDDGARQLPHDITERLRVARQQALLVAGDARRALAARPAADAGVVMVPAGLALAGQGGQNVSWPGAQPGPARRTGRPDDHQDERTSWGVKLASLLPLLALLGGLWGINTWAHREQIQAAAEVDTALLTDDLPPAAYADPGFEEYLLSSNGTPAVSDVTDTAPALPTADDTSPVVSPDEPTDLSLPA